MENKTCSKGHINPPEAQYCRICRESLNNANESFTLDLFPDIHFVPVSIKKIKFLKGIEVFSLIVFPICIIAALLLFDGYRDIWEGVDDLPDVFILLFIASISSAIGTICGLIHYIDGILYKSNADYIEETTFELVRIAKHRKLGLFNQKKRKLLLRPRYDRIDKFDSKHVLIGNQRFVGLYSIPCKKVIVPVQCDTISPVKDGVFEVSIAGGICHYDVYGNKLF